MTMSGVGQFWSAPGGQIATVLDTYGSYAFGVTLRAILHHEMAAKLHHSITANVHRLDGCFNELSVWADKAVGW
jgi:hypothetical protein